jgi:hypothetical protein
LLGQEQYREYLGTSGTGSIIEFRTVVPASFDGEAFYKIRVLSDAECVELFGVTQPARADFEPLAVNESERLHDYVAGGRGHGRCVVLWADGAPAEIVFWGCSPG